MRGQCGIAAELFGLLASGQQGLLKTRLVLGFEENRGVGGGDFGKIEAVEAGVMAVRLLAQNRQHGGLRAVEHGHRLSATPFDNAVRHSPEGGRVRVSCQVTHARWLLDVADEGPGVAPADRERAFERFGTLADPADSVATGGTGLGRKSVSWGTSNLPSPARVCFGIVRPVPILRRGRAGRYNLNETGTPP